MFSYSFASLNSFSSLAVSISNLSSSISLFFFIIFLSFHLFIIQGIAGSFSLSIDYNATAIGSCTVEFADYDISFDPIEYFDFNHVRSRDFNKDTKVNFSDFAKLAFYWQDSDCNDPNWCEGTDLDTDGSVDHNDLIDFGDYWLEKTR